MKQQEIIEKALREKLEGAEMEPPAALFERIAAQLDQPVTVAWYRKPAVFRIASAFTLLAVSAGLLFNNWPAQEENLRHTPGLASYDSLQQERVNSRLESLRLAATQSASQAAPQVAAQKKTDAMQPEAQPVRLAAVTESNTSMETATNRQSEMLQAMEIRQLSGLRAPGVRWQTPKKVAAPEVQLGYASAEEDGLLPTLSKSYSLLNNGGLFELAKERFDDFKTKEHYVSFHLGSFEIGQTIQLSRQEEAATTENK